MERFGVAQMARVGGRPRSLSENPEKNSNVFVQALDRGLVILSLFDIENPTWSLADISQRTGIPKTTTYRMLRTLQRRGFVVYHPDTETYGIGPAVIPVAYLSLSYVGFSHLTHPILEKLAQATGETIELTVPGQEGIVVVDQVTTSRPFKPNLPLGRALRNLATSGSKIIAAYLPTAQQEQLLSNPQEPRTPHTITDPARIREELAAAAKTGLAYDLEEQDLGICAVSAPVFGSTKEVIAAVTVIAPTERFGPKNKVRFAAAVKAAAAELSKLLSQSPAVSFPGRP